MRLVLEILRYLRESVGNGLKYGHGHIAPRYAIAMSHNKLQCTHLLIMITMDMFI